MRQLTILYAMKLTLLFVTLLFISSRMHAQTVYADGEDGVLYFKLDDTCTMHPSVSNPPIDMLPMIAQYQVTDISCPFHMPDVSLQHVYRARFDNHAAVDSFITDLQGLAYVNYAERSQLALMSYSPNDYVPSAQWHLGRIDATSAWNVTTGSASVIIAIVDNGVNFNHQDLAANVWTNPGEIPNNNFDDDLDGYVDDVHGYDVADDDGSPLPPPGALNSTPFIHGTHCAGIASAVTDNSTGVASIGFRCQIMSVKCAKNTSDGLTLTNAFEGVDFAVSAGADIVSMSFGSPTNSATWTYVIAAANAQGVVLIAAAGNDNVSTPYYPAANNNVIAVGATETNDNKAYYSNYGTWIDVMAPGSGIFSTFPDGGNTYGTVSGTSMACPLVAGLAGLVRSLNPSWTPAQVAAAISNGCDNINAQNPSYIGQIGAGRINAFHTLQAVGIQPLEAFSAVHIFPNVSDGQLFFITDADLNPPLIAEVYSMAGEKVKSIPVPAPARGETNELDLRGILPDGAYLLRLVSREGVLANEKIILQSR